jgi:uncharacterized protein with GYD domain
MSWIAAWSKVGATVKELFWTHGPFDSIAIVDAPDEIAVTALALHVGEIGDVRTQTLRAITASEMKAILKKMPKKK